MRRISAIGLIVALIGHPALAASLDPPDPSGPIARSVRTEAARLATAPAADPVSTGWHAVREIEPGTSIEITTPTGLVTRTFVAADDSSMTVLRLALPGLSEQSKKRLTRLAAEHPTLVVNAAAGMSQKTATVSLENGGAIVDGVRVAELTELIENVRAGDVVLVSRTIRRGSGAAAAFGAIGGLYLGSLLAGLAINANCSHSSSCGWTGVMSFAAVIGVPILTGYGSWRASSRVIHEVVYP